MTARESPSKNVRLATRLLLCCFVAEGPAPWYHVIPVRDAWWMIEIRQSRTAQIDPKLPFAIGGANGSFLIAKRPSFDELSRPRA